MASTVNISIQENLEVVSLGVSISDSDVNILVEENSNSEVNIAIVDGANGRDGRDGKDGSNGQDGVSFPFHYVVGLDISGQGNVLVTGELEGISVIPFTGRIIGWYMYETSSTPIATTTVVDVWKDIYGAYPPTVADSIFVTKPNLTAETKNSETGLSVAVTQYDVLKYKLDSNDLGKSVKLALIILRD